MPSGSRRPRSCAREFGSDVRFQSFEVSFSPRVHVVARGVVVGNNTAHPLIQVASAVTPSPICLPWHIRTLVLEGLSVHIPTTESPGGYRAQAALDAHASTRSFPNMHTLKLCRRLVQTTPLHLELAQLRVKNFVPRHAADFSATGCEFGTSTPKFSPAADWVRGTPRIPALHRCKEHTRMPHCDLATLPGLKGVLSSQGRFQGTLQRLSNRG